MIHTQPDSNTLDNIRLLYGADVSRELLHIAYDDPGLKFSLEGYVSNANYNKKKSVFILFINRTTMLGPYWPPLPLAALLCLHVKGALLSLSLSLCV